MENPIIEQYRSAWNMEYELIKTEPRDAHLHVCFVCLKPFKDPDQGVVYMDKLPICDGCASPLLDAMEQRSEYDPH